MNKVDRREEGWIYDFKSILETLTSRSEDSNEGEEKDFLEKIGQSRPLLCSFSFVSHHNSIIN